MQKFDCVLYEAAIRVGIARWNLGFVLVSKFGRLSSAEPGYRAK
jgi:hypothetical protein